MATWAHDPTAVPVRCAPATPIRMGTVFVPDEPTAFHLCYAQRRTPGTRHFAGLHRQVHVFSGVSVLIVYTQLTDALGKAPVG